MLDPMIEMADRHPAGALEGPSFERDTMTWAFARLAEFVLDQLFREPEDRHRYASWLQDEARLLVAGADSEHGLSLIDLNLAADGQFDMIARPCEGEFIFTVRHSRFNVVLASSYAVLAQRPEQESVCIAHFDGDASLAARWAIGLRHSLRQRRRDPMAKASSSLRMH